MSQAAFAKASDDNTRPGWGHGDKNHVHTGPPGQSVRPDHDKDDDEHDENHENHDNHEHHENEHDN